MQTLGLVYVFVRDPALNTWSLQVRFILNCSIRYGLLTIRVVT
jgi:hypothetical protein